MPDTGAVGRSVLVVVAGFLAMMVVVMLGTLAATLAFVPGGLSAATSAPTTALPRSYLAANLIVSFVGAVGGALIVGRLAAGSKWGHIAAFGALMVVMTLVTALTQSSQGSGQPDWYRWVIPLVGLAGVAIGGWLTR